MDHNLTTAVPLLFNDVYSSPWEALSPAPSKAESFPFLRLPVELRLHVWLLYLRRHRMVEVMISRCFEDEALDDTEPRHYMDRNHLGRVISGGCYTLVIHGHEPKTMAPLILQVNREARGAALSFYQVQLPFPRRQHRKQVIYLNPEYDVILVRPGNMKLTSGWDLLIDFLHDVRAYDYKDQGYIRLFLLSPLYCTVVTSNT